MNRWNRPALALPLLGSLLIAGLASFALAAPGPTTLSGTYSSTIVDWPKGKTGTVRIRGYASGSVDADGRFSLALPTSSQIESGLSVTSGIFAEKSNADSDEVCEGRGTATPMNGQYFGAKLRVSIDGDNSNEIVLKFRPDTHLPYPVGQKYGYLIYFNTPTTLNGSITCQGYIDTYKGMFPAGWSFASGTVTSNFTDVVHTHLVTADPLPTNVTWHLYDLSAGIGVQLDAKVAGVPGITISGVAAGRPAERAGVKVADQLVEIDGKDVSAMSSDQVVPLLRGAANTTVTIGIKRGAETIIRRFNLVRAEIQIP